MTAEGNGSALCVHGIHNRKRFHMVIQLADDPTTDPEALLLVEINITLQYF